MQGIEDVDLEQLLVRHTDFDRQLSVAVLFEPGTITSDDMTDTTNQALTRGTSMQRRVWPDRLLNGWGAHSSEMPLAVLSV